MIRIGILGDIGSGKSYVAKNFGYPVFNADFEVGKLYKKNRKIFNKLKKVLPKYIYSFPINKNEISNAILVNKSNLKKIIEIVHIEIRKKMNIFLSKNKNKKIVILDIPLLLENKINKKNDILIFVESNKLDTLKRLRQRRNFNLKLIKKFKNIQLPLDYKKKKSQFLIKNDFTKKSVTISIKEILKDIL
ncbi:dephospho-CoA kinase [Candidatus Pelagibacter sp.]|jgi:dephospho-CoA kinase|nr:dephospho-CoA kinase [Candidatus Pelagibacter sp.]